MIAAVSRETPTAGLHEELETLLLDISALGYLVSCAPHDRVGVEHLDGGQLLQSGAMIERKAKRAFELAETLRALQGGAT